MSSVVLGALIGAIFSGWFTDRFGRRFMLIIAALGFISGTIYINKCTKFYSSHPRPIHCRPCYWDFLLYRSFIYFRNVSCLSSRHVGIDQCHYHHPRRSIGIFNRLSINPLSCLALDVCDGFNASPAYCYQGC